MKTETNYLYVVKNLKNAQVKSLEQKIEWLDEICILVKADSPPERIVQLIRLTQKSLMSNIDTLKEETAAYEKI